MNITTMKELIYERKTYLQIARNMLSNIMNFGSLVELDNFHRFLKETCLKMDRHHLAIYPIRQPAFSFLILPQKEKGISQVGRLILQWQATYLRQTKMKLALLD